MKNVLIISNGHGEDLIAAKIAEKLMKANFDISIIALPIVGIGSAYQALGIPLLLPGKNLPSGGFVRNGLNNLWVDLKAGLGRLTLNQIKSLKHSRKKIDLTICVGDIFVLLLSGSFVQKPIVFLPTAKSNYIAPHWPIEVCLMRRFAKKVFTRDLITAQSLKANKIDAKFVGNIMMDCLNFTDINYREQNDEWIIGILPGSRFEAYENMKDIGDAVIAFERLIDKTSTSFKTSYIIALGDGLLFSKLAQEMELLNWSSSSSSSAESGKGIVGFLNFQRLNRPIELVITQGCFADVLKSSNVIIGMAGTANEQAVGLGKPLLTFAGRGPQFTPKFVDIQKKLLGEAICVVEREPAVIAKKLWALLTDKQLAGSMAKEGKKRMGEPGGTESIVKEIFQIIETENIKHQW